VGHFNSRKLRARAARKVCALVGLLAPVAGLADDTQPTPGPQAEAIDEVVVTGIRASLRSSLEFKRDSSQIVDSISAEDIGDFPDKNLSEALQRVTGVQITRQDGEGRGVSVRGAEPGLIRVEVNGTAALSLTVAATDRSIDFRDLPVEFVSRIEVVKTPTAEMTEGGISTVRINTRRPFDSPDGYVAGSAQAVYSDLAEATDPKLALFGSNLFFDDRLGVLIAAQWEKRHLYDATANTTGWNRVNPPTSTTCAAALARGDARRNDFNQDGTCDWYPQIPRYINNRRETERRAVNTMVEFRPTDNFKTFWDVTYARGFEEVDNSLLQLNADGGLFDYANTAVGADNTVSHIEFTGNGANGTFPLDLSYRNILGSLTRTQYTTSLGAEWEITPSWTVDARVDYSEAKVHNDEINSTAQVFGLSRAIVDYTGSKAAPEITFPAGFDLNSGTGVNRLDSVYNPRDNNTDEITGGFNVKFAPVDWLAIKVGAQQHNYTTDQILRQKTVRLSCRTPAADTTSANNIVVAQVPCTNIEAIINTYSQTNGIGFYKTGDLGFDNSVRFWNDNTDATISAALAAAGAVNPLAGNLDVNVPNTNPNTNGTFIAYLDNWTVEEETLGAYTQFDFRFDELRMPIAGNIGVRYVETDTLSTGYNRVVAPMGVVTFPPGEAEGNYNEVLPSLNLKVGLIPDVLVARLAAGKVLARPSPSQLAIRLSRDVVGLTGSRGNPDLLPFLATNYDLGLEWYFSDTNYASLAIFRKDISRFILLQTVGEVNPNDGLTYQITSPINGDDEVTIDGIEGGVQYSFDFLPGFWRGFGLLANYTYQKDKGFTQTNIFDGSPLTFPGLSRNSYNASLYYENERFSARASYNWRDQWLITASGRGSLPEFNREYGQLDASLGFNFNENVSLFLEGINLTNEELVQENAPARPIQFETFGRRFFMGVRGKF
jgi:iron complex outermembrane receptor protein